MTDAVKARAIRLVTALDGLLTAASCYGVDKSARNRRDLVSAALEFADAACSTRAPKPVKP